MTPDELLEKIAAQVADENARYRDALDVIWSLMATYDEFEFPNIDTLGEDLQRIFVRLGYPDLGDGGDPVNTLSVFEKKMGRECPDPYLKREAEDA